MTRRGVPALLTAAALVAGLGGASPPSPDLGRLKARAVQAGTRFAAARERLQRLNAREAALAARVGANRTALIRLLGALERWRRDPPPALVVHPRQAVDAARAALLMRAAAPELERRARALAADVAALGRVRRAAAEADAALFVAESAAAETRTAADTLAATLTSPEERTAQAQARAAAGVSAAASPSAPPRRLVAPVPGPPTRRFGQLWPGHGRLDGLVWAPASGAAVNSPALGRVEYAGPLKGFALVVVLRLAGDWRVVLAGLQTVTAAPGAELQPGETLGRMGPRARGAPELYLELRRGAQPVDPTGRLGLKAAPRIRSEAAPA